MSDLPTQPQPADPREYLPPAPERVPITIEDLQQPVSYNEDVGRRFADFILYAWQECAENFAAELARCGCWPSALRDKAKEWRHWDLDPPEYADALDAFADSLVAMEPES